MLYDGVLSFTSKKRSSIFHELIGKQKNLSVHTVYSYRDTLTGQRDHALLALLNNTGARIQGALDVCPSAVRFEPPARVELFEKGRNNRIRP